MRWHVRWQLGLAQVWRAAEPTLSADSGTSSLLLFVISLPVMPMSMLLLIILLWRFDGMGGCGCGNNIAEMTATLPKSRRAYTGLALAGKEYWCF